jgi:hypothetical protein
MIYIYILLNWDIGPLTGFVLPSVDDRVIYNITRSLTDKAVTREDLIINN